MKKYKTIDQMEKESSGFKNETMTTDYGKVESLFYLKKLNLSLMIDFVPYYEFTTLLSV